MKNIVVLVSGGGTNLQALLDAERNGQIPNGKITCVIASNPSAYALERAKKFGVKGLVLERKHFDSTADYSKAMVDTLKAEKADLIILAGFLTILDAQVTKAFPNQILNIHPALIPSFCGKGFYGMHVHEAVLKSGVKVTGATVHFVSEVCDGGPILLQKAVDVKPNDTPEILQRRVMEECEWKLLPKAAAYFCNNQIEFKDGKAFVME